MPEPFTFIQPRAETANGKITIWFPGSTVGFTVGDVPENREAIQNAWNNALEEFKDALWALVQAHRG